MPEDSPVDRGPIDSSIDKSFAAVAAAVLALILYGSLYPFQFHPSLPAGSLVRLLLSTAKAPVDRGDLVSNILLYLPLGFFGVRAFHRGSPITRAVLVTLFGAVLSTSIEFTQFYDFGRGPSLADAFGNTLGTLIGAVASVLLRRNPPFAWLLLLAWVGDHMVPFVPSFRFHKYAAALHPLIADPRLHPLEVYSQFALWLAAAVVLEALLGADRSRPMCAALVAFALASRVVMEGTLLSASEVAGAVLAVITWIFLSRLRLRIAIVAAIFVAFVALEALRPFQFLAVPHPFNWMPFLAFMDGPRENGSRVFLEKTYVYGSLVWLLARSGFSQTAATVAAVIFVFGLRLIQVYLPGRSAEISDALMVLILAGLMSLLDAKTGPPRPAPLAPCRP